VIFTKITHKFVMCLISYFILVRTGL